MGAAELPWGLLPAAPGLLLAWGFYTTGARQEGSAVLQADPSSCPNPRIVWTLDFFSSHLEVALRLLFQAFFGSTSRGRTCSSHARRKSEARGAGSAAGGTPRAGGNRICHGSAGLPRRKRVKSAHCPPLPPRRWEPGLQ